MARRIEPLAEYAPLIPSRKARAALEKLFDGVSVLNADSGFPAIVKVVGVSGEALLRAESSKLIATVSYELKAEIADEWLEFEDTVKDLKLGMWIVARKKELAIRLGKKRIQMSDFIDNSRDELLGFGFRDRWLDQWLPWARFSDIYTISNVPFLGFGLDELVRRRVAKTCPSIISVEASVITPEGDAPPFNSDSIVVWRDGNRVRPSEDIITGYLHSVYSYKVRKLEELRVWLRNYEDDTVGDWSDYFYTWMFYTHPGMDITMVELLKDFVNRQFEMYDHIVASDMDIREKISRLMEIEENLSIIGLVFDAIQSSGLLPYIRRNGLDEGHIREILLKHVHGVKRDHIRKVLNEIDVSAIAKRWPDD